MDYKPLIAVILLSTQAIAQTAFDPLSISIGARALGMGGACAAAAEDCDTVFSNPAGLGEVDSFNFSSMSGNLLEDVHYLVLADVFPLGERSAVGLGYTGSFVSGIEIRNANSTLINQANYGSGAAVLSYGRKLTDKLSLGTSLKYYFTDGTEFDSGDGAGWNADIGILQKGLDWLTLGLAAQNLLGSSRINYQNGGSEPLPQTVMAGARIYLLGSGFNAALPAPFELNCAFDAHFDLHQAGAMTGHAGIEFSPNPLLIIRAGSDQGNFTMGLSLKAAGLGFHYAYQNYGGFEGNDGHYFSITYDERGWPPEVPSDVYLGCKDRSAMIK